MEQLVIQRIVFPYGFELPSAAAEIESLYFKTKAENAADQDGGVPDILGRTRVRLSRGQTLNTDTYFNRLHAGYWLRWTKLQSVQVRASGQGEARVVVRRSTAGGMETTVRVMQGQLADGLSCDVPLISFAAGGCLWLEVEALSDTVELDEAGFWGDASEQIDLRTDIAVCTYNRPQDVLALLSSLRDDEMTSKMINKVWLIDNGEQSFTELDGADAVVQALGDKLQHIKQANLGGSGGFSRGLYEASYNSDAPTVMLLDDDVVIEPEGVRRAVVFYALAKRPLIVGGHMLNRAEPAMLHSSAEWVNTKTMRWGPAPGGHESIKLATERIDYVLDAAFNAWWCCLIPTEAVRKVGLGMPFFIKYDDVEFGYRAARAGYRSVSLPGAAVWHEPWSLKDDTTDWTLYFHVRNRLIFAALMSAGLPEKIQKARVNTVVMDVMKRDIVRNVLRRAYASAASADLAMRDFLRGPEILREPLEDAVARVREYRKDYPDAQASVPNGGAGEKPTSLLRTKGPKLPVGLPRAVVREYGVAVPKLLPIPVNLLKKQTADPWLIWSMPEDSGAVAELPKVADHWWALADVPDAWVTTVDGAKMTRRTRLPALSRSLTRQAWTTAKEVRSDFGVLSSQYAAQWEDLTTPSTWAAQFGIEIDQ